MLCIRMFENRQLADEMRLARVLMLGVPQLMAGDEKNSPFGAVTQAPEHTKTTQANHKSGTAPDMQVNKRQSHIYR